MASSASAYESTLEFLYRQLPMFSKSGKEAMKAGLDNIVALCEALDEPYKKFPSIHVAGTNGKGSTSHMLAAIFQQCGYKVGLYTSPHLTDFRERIKINGIPVTRQWVVEFVHHLEPLIARIRPSFFEITVAMAFQAFASEKVDIAIIETGLGGRLDSTNVITPLLSVITNISFDHTDILGDSLEKIAAEKSGIIKKGVPVLIGERNPITDQVFLKFAASKGSPVYFAPSLWKLAPLNDESSSKAVRAIRQVNQEEIEFSVDLSGSYQIKNLTTVLGAVEIVSGYGNWNLPLVKVQTALSRVKALTGIRGRWEILKQHPLVIADVAHNPAGVELVMQQFHSITSRNKIIVVGFVKDKDIREALSKLPKDARYFFTNAAIERALPAAELQQMALKEGLKGDAFGTVEEAVLSSLAIAEADDIVLITGSFFVVGEALSVFVSPGEISDDATDEILTSQP